MPHWTFTQLEECDSTFYPARALPAWHAISTKRQSHGRGRFQRTWFGEKGGLWICYNVPIDESLDVEWGQLPLVAGVALIESLAHTPIEGLRLRWPNDLLVGRAKLGGILVERPSATVASIGIGVNISNDIASLRGKTSDPVTRLQDLMGENCPSVEQYAQQLGDALLRSYQLFVTGGIAALQGSLHKAWAVERPVVAITDDARHCGFFVGVDAKGYPLLRSADGSIRSIAGIDINRLVELC